MSGFLFYQWPMKHNGFRNPLCVLKHLLYLFCLAGSLVTGKWTAWWQRRETSSKPRCLWRRSFYATSGFWGEGRAFSRSMKIWSRNMALISWYQPHWEVSQYFMTPKLKVISKVLTIHFGKIFCKTCIWVVLINIMIRVQFTCECKWESIYVWSSFLLSILPFFFLVHLKWSCGVTNDFLSATIPCTFY